MSEDASAGNLDGFVRAVAVIIFSEIGDKTFLIAAILSMRHSRATVFAGAFLALAVMSALSAGLGQILPALISKQYTTLAAALLFFVFGAAMLREALAMNSAGGMAEEMEEVERELMEEIPLEELPGHRRKPSTMKERAMSLKRYFDPILVQTFVLTFLGEWGDRSQITTIALAATHNVVIVALGTIIGHSLCTLLAVVAGRWISNVVSVKHVSLGGAVLFLVFGVIYTYEAYSFRPIDVSVPNSTSPIEDTLMLLI